MVSYVESQKRPSLYTIDAKRKGNIGRFFNHSCEPNMRTCHVYVDTHDFRLPWIAFFTTKYVPAGTVSYLFKCLLSFTVFNNDKCEERSA